MVMMELRNQKSNIAAHFENAPAKFILPPIGVFWDIENCQVPKGKSAIALVQKIREKSLGRHREAEFMCVCDINKESKTVIRELNLSQVTVVHINATCKNAADDKLKQCMRRFVDVHGTPSTLLLISNDVNFAVDLSDFRHRHNVRIILFHTSQAPEPLLACAHEHYDFFDITNELPYRSPMKVLFRIGPNFCCGEIALGAKLKFDLGSRSVLGSLSVDLYSLCLGEKCPFFKFLCSQFSLSIAFPWEKSRVQN